MTERSSSQSWTVSIIEDARGRSVSQLDPKAMKLLRRCDTIPAEALRGIVKDVALLWATWVAW